MTARLAAFAAAAALLCASAQAVVTGSADLLTTFKPQIAAIKKRTSVPVLLPHYLPFAAKVPKLFPSGGGTARTWELELAGAPRCGGANACFLASFDARRGGKLPGAPNLRLAGGQPARYKGITCGASCSPVTLWFTYRGVLYTWQHKDPPANAKAVLARLAAEAISAGPR